MTPNEKKSLFDGINFFRRASQTWAAVKTVDTDRLSHGARQFEMLESRVLMSVAHPLVQVAATPPHPAHVVNLKTKAKAPAPVAPSAPTGLNAVPLTFNSVQLSWSSGDEPATGFIVLRATDGAHYSQIAKFAGAATTYTDKSVVSSHSYSYEVEAYTGALASPASAPAAASTALAAPATFAASAAGPTSVHLTWAINETLASGYTVLRSTDGVHFSQLVQLPAPKIGAYTDTAVSSNTVYLYEIQAYNGNKTSAVSAAARVTTPLIAPTALAASFQNTAVVLTWTGNDSSATGYLVFRSSDGKSFTQIATVGRNGPTTFADTSAVSGCIYTYKVQAYAGGNTSAASPVVTLNTPLKAPSALAAAASGPTAVRLSWTGNDRNAAGYLVLRSTDGVHYTQIAKLMGQPLTTYTDAGAVSGTSYYYQVRAYAGTITSDPANAVAVTTPLTAPAALIANAASPTSATLAWSAGDPLTTGYRVLRSTDGTTYSQLTQIASASTFTYTDGSASSDTTYFYEIEAFSATSVSAPSSASSVITPLAAASGLTATIGRGAVQLSWIDNDSTAAGYLIFRSSDAKPFMPVANANSPAATNYADTTILSGHSYSYIVQAYNGANLSAMSSIVSVGTPLTAPSSLAVTANTAAGVQLSWTNNDANALGFYVLRSTDGAHFTQLAALTVPATSNYTDATIATGASYTYEVEAYAGDIASAPSNKVNPTVPLAAPATLTATLTGAYVSLAWTDRDSAATGYDILRSTDGVTFTQLTQLADASVKSYTDLSATGGQTYDYQVRAYNLSVSSAVSNTATIATPGGNVTNGVSVTTRFGDELIITATGASDTVVITESGDTLTITGDGQVFIDAAPAGGTFVYTRGGSDSVTVNSSVTSPLTIDSIDAASTVINSGGAAVSAWVDSTDTLFGTATAHPVASFAAGVSKALGASLANPKDAGTTAKDNLSLFGTGPTAADVNQGSVGDCYFLASLAAFADESPQTLVNSAVDLGDGTYAVEFHASSGPVYVRVNNSFTVGGFGGYSYAHPGADDTIWAAVMEKAFAYFRTGANTYNSINSGWMNEVYTDLGVQSTSFTPSAFSDNDLFNLLSIDLSEGDAVSFGTQNAPNLVQSHAYTLLSVTNTGGVNHYVVRNPWGQSGDSLENSQGIATLTYAQFVANFVSGTAALN